MIRFFFRQKMRIERGMCLMPLANFLLLTISASDRIQRWTGDGVSTTAILAVSVPTVFMCLWCFGYLLYTPRFQAAEDAEISAVLPWRRDVRAAIERAKGGKS